MSEGGMNFKLIVFRQDGPNQSGRMVPYTVSGISEHASFLEMLDILNEDLVKRGEPAIQFESDCREGICGSCSLVINGKPHGPQLGTATCQLHMRVFKGVDTIVVEPWRAKAFPVIHDLVVDRSSFDRIIAAGGYVSSKSGPHADANAILISKPVADKAMDAAACIGCGACVAACPNASASLFTSAKITQLALLPQGHPERRMRALKMVDQMDQEGFGSCTNVGECQSACPKEISIDTIGRMKREYACAMFSPEDN